MKKNSLIKLFVLFALVVQTGCGIGASAPKSDVPCFEPTTWANSTRELLFQFEEGNPNHVLFFHQSLEQADIDRSDGVIAFHPHDPIYRLNRITNVVDIVDDTVWDNNSSEISDCLRYTGHDSPFTTAHNGQLGQESDLLYNDVKVEVEGGTFLRLYPATFTGNLHTPAVAVLSTNGFAGISFFFLGGIAPTGQRFHQLFSEVDGQPLGPPLRIGLGGPNKDSQGACWALENKFVIYTEDSSDRDDGHSNICVVDVEDEVQSVTGNILP